MYRYTCILIITFLNVHLTKCSVMKLLQGPYHPPPIYEICSSDIYCQGELLCAIQTANIFPASKTFVDMKMLRSEKDILIDFYTLKKNYNASIPQFELRKFVEQNFARDNLDRWMPSDFREYPLIMEYIIDRTYKEFLFGANQIWKDLARKISKTVDNKADVRHSMIYVPNGFFVNMEFEQDFNYWDAYWIIRGALICGMEKTVKGILENFLYLIRRFGYVPYGNRLYYEGRSQPPLLTQMMASYYTYTNDQSFIIDNIQLLDGEMTFWLLNRDVDIKQAGNTYSMTHYMNDAFDPRPEKYNIDLNVAKLLQSEQDENEFYCRVKAASESGWGFSSKHFHNRYNYDDIKKTILKTNPLNYAYVELNSIMQSNANLISKMYLLIDDKKNSDYYKQIARRIQIGINALLWNEDEQMWFDYDTSSGSSRNYFYASNLAPLWTGSYDEKLSEYYGDAAVNYLIKNNIINADLTPRYLCVPTSMFNSGFDWDYHNCYPQLQSMVIFGLHSTKSERAKRVALNLASSWVHINFIGYKESKTFYEKYSATRLGGNSQTSDQQPKGYGVTIGLLFQIFYEWGHVLESKK